MITVQMRKVKDPKLMVAVLDLLKKHYRSGYQVHKPRASVTYTLTIDGPDEDAFLGDFRGVAGAAGWTFPAETSSGRT